MRRAKSGSHTMVVAMFAVFSLSAILMAGCAGPDSGGEVTVFEGARLIVGPRANH